MFGAEQLALVVIVLQANFRKLARVESQVGRNARALITEDIAGIVSAWIAICVFAAQAGHPARFKPPKHLGVKAPITQVFCRKPARRIASRFETLIQGFSLPRDEREPRMGIGRFPFPINVHAIDLGVAIVPRVIWPESAG